ncbi:uracil phosphoribosyltransferase [Mycoplasma marinum]|uniref:Uracil phosphoribosyltransferase n=1 Tax=Mycoplasma marinum TaxID=1937190 RepID=A0A4R0XW18_9MOLU|nr:uracil phosphoribosyltransferase [Mycoplasma marinum]TCG12007.1 uracil phosphoribosyltransferase [Mycoplasma marinum]
MVKVLSHPLIEQKLTKMRSKECSSLQFRKNLNQIASLMTYEILLDYKMKSREVQTPTGATAKGCDFDKEIVIVPILRAGLGMVQGIEELVPQARIGHIGLYRDEETFEAVEYFYKMPAVAKDSRMLVVDPMLATGISASDTIARLKKDGFTDITLVCLVGVQEGLDKIAELHPKVNVFLAALDPVLNDKKYIMPGLGDAGDRIFGTK